MELLRSHLGESSRAWINLFALKYAFARGLLSVGAHLAKSIQTERYSLVFRASGKRNCLIGDRQIQLFTRIEWLRWEDGMCCPI